MRKLIDKAISLQSLSEEFPHDIGESVMNPSIITVGEDIYISARITNYQLLDSMEGLFYTQAQLYSYPLVKKLGDDFVPFRYPVPEKTLRYNGFEDGRLCMYNNELHLIGSINKGDAIVMLDINVSNEEQRYLPTPINVTSTCEKNWMWVPSSLPQFIYEIGAPTKVISYDRTGYPTIRLCGKSKEGLPNLRGGTQLIPYKTGYIALAHEKEFIDGMHYSYVHRLVSFTEDLGLNFISEPFKLIGERVEFCSGWTKDKDENFLLTFSVNDADAYLMKLKFEDIINPELIPL